MWADGVLTKGSPPRARGRPDRADRARVCAGLTPACAGTSPVVAPIAGTVVGSPPRARGRRVGPAGRGVPRGLTPACAGTSHRQRFAWCATGAHPRVRGDVDFGSAGSIASLGSPPRARGRRIADPPAELDRGLTPACAGTSGAHRRDTGARWAHPRVRGDVVGDGEQKRLGEGSPPRARGRRRAGSWIQRARGLTPACAGTSDGSRDVSRGVRAHPRVRGDVRPWRARWRAPAGSPPRARGRPYPRRGNPGDHGLTPACAGTSSPTPTLGGPTRAHPRVRGDVPPAHRDQAPESGSPPRARGRQEEIPVGSTVQGLTPACAGTSHDGSVEMCESGGSPPRARGRPDPIAAHLAWMGLTPACAGTSRAT